MVPSSHLQAATQSACLCCGDGSHTSQCVLYNILVSLTVVCHGDCTGTNWAVAVSRAEDDAARRPRSGQLQGVCLSTRPSVARLALVRHSGCLHICSVGACSAEHVAGMAISSPSRCPMKCVADTGLLEGASCLLYAIKIIPSNSAVAMQQQARALT